ncbi:MAG: tetratricopeptide repeat protein [Myxococcota bacterium]
MGDTIQGYQFGPFRLMLSPRKLLRGDQELRAQPLSLELLLCGLQQPGEVIPREMLLQTLRSEVPLSDHSLSQLVYKTRKLLREHKQWWRSVHGHGYCFDAPVQEIIEPSPAHLEPASPHAASMVPNNLSHPKTTFVGRQQELHLLGAILDGDQRLITILGTGGLGKSRLALELARQQKATAAARWPGGIWFVSLADARTEAGVWLAVARALDIPLQGAPQQRLLWALQNRGQTLLILDNFEQIVEHSVETVGRWLRQIPALRCVVTSRQRLSLSGEQLFNLDLLTEDSALALFEARVQQVRPGFALREDNRADSAALVELLDRLPLAIELAAARCRMLSPQMIRDRMDRRFVLLKSSVSDLPPRHRTLHATLEWSWEMLDETMRAVLCQCSIFEGGMSLEAAAAVIAVPSGEDGERLWVEDVLAELLDRSLLQIDDEAGEQGRISMLLSIQDFARGKCTTQLSDPDALVRRYGSFFASLAHSYGAQENNAELDNLMAATQHLLALRDVQPRDLDDAMLCVRGAGRVLKRTGPILGGIAWLMKLADHQALLSRHHAQLLIEIGSLQLYSGAPAQAEVTLLKAKAVSGAVDARLLIHLGGACWQQNRLTEAEAHHREALPLSRAAGSLREESMILTNLGMICGHSGKKAEAERLYKQAFTMIQEHGDREIAIRNLNCMGVLYVQQKRFEEAEACYREALKIAVELGSRNGESLLLGNLGTMMMKQGNVQETEAYLEKAITISRQIGDRKREANFVVNLVGHLFTLGRMTDMARYLERTLPIARSLGLHRVGARLLEHKGNMAWRQQRTADAEAHWREGLALARLSRDVESETNLLENLKTLRAEPADESANPQ